MTDPLTSLAAALADRYRLERELGQGGMAHVYLAHDLRHDRKVAVKVLRPDLSAILGGERFLAEIKTTANLQHPHILPLHDSGEAAGLIFYVMPFVEGESLRDRLTREHQMPVDDAIRIACEVADALDYAHGQGVIHRDIKPENILVYGGHALVADFGIALAASRTEGASRMTETGMSLGTPQYMAPEQAMGEREISPRVDIYALGCVLYEMLVGEPPFTGPTAQAILARVMTEAPRSITLHRRTVPPQVEAAVLQAMEKLPADRFPSAGRFAEALQRPGALPTPAAASARRPRRLAALLPWGLALAAVGVAVGDRLTRPSAPGPTWQYLSLGDSVRVRAIAPALALAPDGRSLVFRTTGQDGHLWLKRWDRLDPMPIPGTEQAFGPAFSPDGAWIAFVADGRLRKTRPEGGTALALADSLAPVPYGIAWLDDNSIIYTGARQDELWRVDAGGGTPTRVLADSAFRGFGFLNPTPLPGARGVLFQVCTSGCVTVHTRVLDLRNGEHRKLFDDVAQAWYLPSGHVLQVRQDGSALAAPFDLDRLEVTGAAVPVLEGVQAEESYAQLAWSPTGSLVYLSADRGSGEREVVRVGRDGGITPVDPGWYGSLNSIALAPDGRRLAVGAGLGSGTTDVWIKQLDRGPFTRLSFGGRDRRPAWSPDGREVAFVRDSANGGTALARRADGSGTDRRLSWLDRPVQEVAWSPDGRWVVVRTDNATAGAGDLIGIRTTGDTTPVPLVASPFSEFHPAVSPDGRWLAYSSNESGISEVYVRSFPETGSGRWQVSNGGGEQPRWAPNGRELFYVDAARRLQAVRVRSVPTFDASAPTLLFDATEFQLDPFHQSYDVSPDGLGFLFLRNWRPPGAPATQRVVLVEHWFADLRTRLAR